MRIPRLPIPKGLTAKLGKIALKTTHCKPGRLLGFGLILGGGAIIMTGIAAWNGKETLQGDAKAIRTVKDGESPSKSAVMLAHGKFVVDSVKIFAVPTIMAAASFYLILRSHMTMKQRIARLTATCTSLAAAYQTVKQNARKMLTPEQYQELLYGVKTRKVIDTESGTETEEVVDPDSTPFTSPHAVWFNEGVFDHETGRWIWRNGLWREDKNELAIIIRNIQNVCNDILRSRGWLLENEVRIKLTLPPTEEGWHMGWVRGGFTDGSAGDDYVDFGVFPDYEGGRYQLPINRAFLDPNSSQRVPLIDFNVVCIDKIWNDIYEYDNSSYISFEKRKPRTLEGDIEDLRRWEAAVKQDKQNERAWKRKLLNTV